MKKERTKINWRKLVDESNEQRSGSGLQKITPTLIALELFGEVTEATRTKASSMLAKNRNVGLDVWQISDMTQLLGVSIEHILKKEYQLLY